MKTLKNYLTTAAVIGALGFAGAAEAAPQAHADFNNNEDFVTHTAILDDGEFNDQFGLSLAAGDFNHDGRDDLAVGVPAEDGVATDTGTVNVIFGAGAGLAVPNNQLVVVQLLAGDRFGAALAR